MIELGAVCIGAFLVLGIDDLLRVYGCYASGKPQLSCRGESEAGQARLAGLSSRVAGVRTPSRRLRENALLSQGDLFPFACNPRGQHALLILGQPLRAGSPGEDFARAVNPLLRAVVRVAEVDVRVVGPERDVSFDPAAS